PDSGADRVRTPDRSHYPWSRGSGSRSKTRNAVCVRGRERIDAADDRRGVSGGSGARSPPTLTAEGVNESTPRMTGGGCRGERRSLPPTLTAEGVNESTPRVTGGGCRGERRSLPPTLT